MGNTIGENEDISGIFLTCWANPVFGESLDELANRQRARIWLPLVGSHSGGIVS